MNLLIVNIDIIYFDIITVFIFRVEQCIYFYSRRVIFTKKQKEGIRREARKVQTCV